MLYAYSDQEWADALQPVVQLRRKQAQCQVRSAVQAPERHLGHEHDAVAEVGAHDIYAPDEHLVQHALGVPAAPEQEVDALDEPAVRQVGEVETGGGRARDRLN